MLNENLKMIRKQKGISQEILAQQLNVVRQTISKWEKGLSVPDAEMLDRISSLFEVPVNKLLGTTMDTETSTNEVAIQLAILNEQFANKRKRNKKILKLVLFLTVVCMIVYIAVAMATHTSLSSRLATAKTTTLVCSMNGEEYRYGITYDDQYQIIEAGGDAFIAFHVETEKYSDANTLIAQIEDYFWEHGGTCERIEEKQ